MFSNLSTIDHSWSVLGATTVGICGTTGTSCTSSTATGFSLGSQCCISSNCGSNFCQCQFDSTGYGVCATAPVGTTCSLSSNCASGICTGGVCQALPTTSTCLNSNQCLSGFVCGVPPTFNTTSPLLTSST